MCGVRGASSTPTYDYSNQVCRMPEPQSQSSQVCEAPPPEEQVCTADNGNASSSHQVTVNNRSTHTSTPRQVSFPPQNHSSSHSSSTSHTQGHGNGHHSAAADIAHAIHPLHTAHQAIDIAEGIAHSSHAAHAAHGAQNMTVASGLMRAGGIALGPVVMIGGAAEMTHGVQQIQHGDTAGGTHSLLSGGAGVVGGGASILSGAGVAAATPVAAGAASFGVGMAVGHYGDNAARDLGILRDSQGRPQSVSDRLADHGVETYEAVRNATGSEFLGHAAGIGRMTVELPAAGVVAVGSAVAGGASWLYHKIAD